MLKSILFLTLVITAIQYGTSNKPPKCGNPPNPPPKNPPKTPKCGPNEKFITNKKSCPGDSCKTKYIKAKCAGNQPTSPGCVCKDGYLRNAAGSCIPKDKCLSDKSNPPPKTTPKCGPNEKYIQNKVACPGDSCYRKYYQYRCVANQTSVPGCVCNDGFLRNAAGNCIREDQCLSIECVDDPNAVKGCGNRCKKTCRDYKDKNKACTRECSSTGCDCPSKYVYDENIQRCVPPGNCTIQCTGANEEYTTCLSGQCRPKTCDQLGKPVPCPKSPRGCQGGCICKEGYVRCSTGKCIDAKKCPSCGNDPNAVTGCGNRCGNSCTDFYKKSLILCPQYCEINGCDCRDKFVYDAKVGKCVKPEKCSDYGCPGNSTYVSCNAQCPTDYCPKDDGPKPQCSPPYPCNGGCRCKVNYRLNSENNCILARECPPIDCTRPNEVFDCCPSACLAEQCADRENQPSTCNTLIENCDPRCVCKPGTWRDENGVCVTPDQCPPLPPHNTDTADT